MTTQGPRLFLTGGWGYGNLGDDAILLSMLCSITRHIPSNSITLTSFNPTETRKHVELDSTPSLHNYLNPKAPKFKKKLLLLLLWIVCKKLGIKYNIQQFEHLRAIITKIEKSDAVILGGGGYFNDLWKEAYPARLLEILIAKTLKKKIIIYGQTVGPFNSTTSRIVLSRVLNMIDYICYRDKQSQQTIIKYKYPTHKAKLTADEANLLTATSSRTETLKKLNINPSSFVIGVVAQHFRPYEAIDGTKPLSQITSQDQYIAELKSAILELKEKFNATIVFLPSTTWDIPTAQRLHDEVSDYNSDGVHFISDTTIRDYIALCQSVDFMLSTNMHPIILATTNLVPSCAISYFYKVDDYMDSLGLKKSVIRIDEAKSTHIFNTCASIIDNSAEIKSLMTNTTKHVREAASLNIQSLISLLNTRDPV